MNIRTKRFIRGLAKSWTAYTGTILAVLGYLQTQSELLAKWFGPDALGAIMMLFGVLIVALRAKTTESLEDKGK